MTPLAILLSTLNAVTPCRGMAAVYYGSNTSDFRRLAANPPEIVIPGDVQILPTAIPILHPAGITVLAYIPTCYADTTCAAGNDYGQLATVEGQVDVAMGDGADGIFFDEATSDATSGTSEGTYYAALFQYVKTRYGNAKIVVTNPGVGNPDPSMLAVSDIVSLECDWDSSQFQPPWKGQYDPRRFLGLDGDCRPAPDAGVAVADTVAAHANGVGFFYATDLYVDLPNWFESYVQTPGVCLPWPDAGSDAGMNAGADAGNNIDAAVPTDAGVEDAALSDAALPDGGRPDATSADAGLFDAGTGLPADAGSLRGSTGCGCSAATDCCTAFGLLWVAGMRRRRAR